MKYLLILMLLLSTGARAVPMEFTYNTEVDSIFVTTLDGGYRETVALSGIAYGGLNISRGDNVSGYFYFDSESLEVFSHNLFFNGSEFSLDDHRVNNVVDQGSDLTTIYSTSHFNGFDLTSVFHSALYFEDGDISNQLTANIINIHAFDEAYYSIYLQPAIAQHRVPIAGTLWLICFGLVGIVIFRKRGVK